MKRPGARKRSTGVDLSKGDRVEYHGPEHDGLLVGTTGVLLTDVPPPMDVRPYATPPTVREDVTVEVDFDGVGHRTVRLQELRRVADGT